MTDFEFYESMDEPTSKHDATLDNLVTSLLTYLDEKAEAQRQLEEHKKNLLNRYFTDGCSYYKVISTESENPECVVCLVVPTDPDYYLHDGDIEIGNSIYVNHYIVVSDLDSTEEITWLDFAIAMDEWCAILRGRVPECAEAPKSKGGSMNNEYIEKFLKDNGLTLEDIQAFAEEMEKTKLAQEKRKQAEERKKKEESLLGKYFMKLRGGCEPVFYKVLGSEPYDYFTCLCCPSSTNLYYYYEDDDSVCINDDICVTSVKYEEFMRMAPVTAEDFAAVVDAWAKKLLTLELPESE